MYYAVEERFSNVETICSFDRAEDRDEWVAASDNPREPLTRKELDSRLALNRRIARGNRGDSGWVNGLPETLAEVTYMPEWE